MYPGREAGAAERWAPGSRSWVLEQLSQEWMGEFRKFEFISILTLVIPCWNFHFLHVSCAWCLLSFLALWVYGLHQIWQIFVYYFFKLPPLPYTPKILIIHILLGSLSLSHRSLILCSFSSSCIPGFILDSCCCYVFTFTNPF